MLRLRFQAGDLARVRLPGTLGPLAETLLALRAIRLPRDAGQRDTGPPSEWRRRVLSGLPPATVGRHLLPIGWTAGDLLALIGATGAVATVESGLAGLRRAGSAGLQRLADVLAVGHELGVAPHWPAMRAQLDADRAARARILADGGIDRLFATLHPDLRWRPPVLDLPGWLPDAVVECELNGRGLDIVPAVFARATPEVYLPGDGPALLIHPVAVDRAAARETGDVPDGLADLLGQTRAAVLTTLTDGSTTGEVARRLRISPAGASQHATVLRRAGLILSTRRGNNVLHTLTPLGAALLDGWLTY